MDVDSSPSKYGIRKVGVENKAFSDDNEAKEDGADKQTQKKVSKLKKIRIIPPFFTYVFYLRKIGFKEVKLTISR